MEQVHSLIAAHEEKVKHIEGQIQQTIMDFNSLQGYLKATKEALVAAQAIIDAVSPTSAVATACHMASSAVGVAEVVVDAVEHLMEG